MRENRPSGLMRGGKQTVTGPRASQSVASRLLYTLPGLSGWLWGMARPPRLEYEGLFMLSQHGVMSDGGFIVKVSSIPC